MPEYRYRCSGCNQEYDAKQAMTDAAYTECPSCKTETLQRVPQPVGISFHGPGFYCNTWPKRNGRS